MSLFTKDPLDSWLKLLSDEERASVMKVQIAETEQTKRVAIEEQEKTRRDLAKSDGHQVVRGLAVFVLVIVAFCGTCVGHRQVEAWQAVRLRDPSVVQGIVPPPAPASSPSARPQ